MLVLPTGWFVLEYRDAIGRFGWRLDFSNGVTVEGANHLLDAGFRGGTRYGTWYAGVIDDAAFTAVSDADTHASHPGWSEFTGLYNGLRPAWSPAPANGGQMGYAARSTAQVTANGTVRGALLASRAAVGPGAGAVLYCTGAAAFGLAVTAGGTLSLGYTLKLNPR